MENNKTQTSIFQKIAAFFASRTRRSIFIKIGLYALMLIVLLIFFYPFIIITINSFKDGGEFALNPLTAPTNPTSSNYSTAWNALDIGTTLLNTILVTVFANIIIIFISSMAAWMLVRFRNIWTKLILGMLLAGLIIPFQALQLPLFQQFVTLNLTENIFGLILAYAGFGTALSVFMMQGFIKQIPVSLEEYAQTTGVSVIKVYFRVIMPLLRPVWMTILILNTMWIWNDFYLPWMMANNNSSFYTLMVSLQSNLIGTYSMEYTSISAGIIILIIPSLLFFVASHKYIIGQVTAGSVK